MVKNADDFNQVHILASALRYENLLYKDEVLNGEGAGYKDAIRLNGSHYMCVYGPVFTYKEMIALPPEF